MNIATFDRKGSGPRVVRLHSGSFEVVGLTVNSPEFPTRAKGEIWLQAELAKLPAAAQPKERPCMCCRQMFVSEGKHNRLCGACRLRASQDDALPFNFGVIHGKKLS